MNVSACLVTRGDVDLSDIYKRLLGTGMEVIQWDNSGWGPQRVTRTGAHQWGYDMLDAKPLGVHHADLAVYGRYAAIQYASGDLIFVQDDDCLLPPDSIEEIVWTCDSGGSAYGQLVCNMPQIFRDQPQYADGSNALVGFGACFHRNLPRVAFEKFFDSEQSQWKDLNPTFLRTCDVVFTTLTPHVLVDVPYENLWWAEANDRMYRQREHSAERALMRDAAKVVRDAS